MGLVVALHSMASHIVSQRMAAACAVLYSWSPSRRYAVGWEKVMRGSSREFQPPEILAEA